MVAVVAMVAAMMAVAGVDGQAKIHIQRRCYVCRSRGELGDCRDQFIPPEPLPPGTPVQVNPPLCLCFFVMDQRSFKQMLFESINWSVYRPMTSQWWRNPAAAAGASR